ncbi:unnamed protein product [Chrysodeixis includens]|uniref:Uncharacterized protein n=1 Tax=Chrysodeixis includens TaxID=689277 RepID=A0A9P0BX74_CHRIL|nr:unnamed protein product [Chrysodeixis includens]
MLRETSAEGGEETAFAVAEAALIWLQDQQAIDADLDDLCSRTHLLYVDGRGALRDCGELPAARGDAPELQEYRREAAERGRASRRAAPARRRAPALPALPALQLGARTPRGACAVLAATRVAGARTTRALLALRGRAAARVAWRDVGRGGAGVAQGGVLGGAREPDGDERRARLVHGRAAHGTAVLGGRLLVCGGYDRARVLRAAEAYDPLANEWTALPDMPCGRARFPAAVLGDALYVLGGSDGHAELETVAALTGGKWRARARLPLAMSHAAAAAVEERGELYLIGGWAGGVNLKRVLRYSPATDEWTEAPPLNTGRSQCGGVYWEGALWALGGCDAWHCVASTEALRLGGGAEGAGWRAGPALPTARRSVGAAAWRGRLVAAGGSDGAASLRRTLAGGAGARGRGLAPRPRAASPARRAGAGRAAGRVVRGGRLRRQRVPVVRGVPVRAGRRVDDAARAARAPDAAVRAPDAAVRAPRAGGGAPPAARGRRGAVARSSISCAASVIDSLPQNYARACAAAPPCAVRPRRRCSCVDAFTSHFTVLMLKLAGAASSRLAACDISALTNL